MMINDQTFADDYLLDVLEELPGSPSAVEYIGEQSRGAGRDGLVVEFLPGARDRSWVGLFAFGDLATRALSGVVVLPDQRVLVVARGTGYAVDPARRSLPTVIKPKPIVDVLVVPDARLVLVADPWSVFAFGDRGLVWNTGRIALDGLSLKGANEKRAFGEVYVSADESRVFSIDLNTGECAGTERLSDR